MRQPHPGSKKEVDAFFESIWKLYPNKKGKGQVSDAKKKKLYGIGLEEITRAIERYKKYVSSIDYLHYQNGSTFFNNGYVDYLDENYTEPDNRVPAAGSRPKNSFQNFEQRSYDYDELEKRLLEKQAEKKMPSP